MNTRLLEVDGLTVSFDATPGDSRTTARTVAHTVVDGVSFTLDRGERLAIVGESGSGKTLTALSLISLLPQAASWRGQIRLNGVSLSGLPDRELRLVRGGRIGVVFQDALTAFNPLRTIGSMLIESAVRHSAIGRAEASRRAVALLERLGVPSPGERLRAYPHQLSGGLRQRCMIALALINDPALIIADEPTTALDATVQAQILAILRECSEDRGLIFITHDLRAARQLCDRALLMRNGIVEEQGTLPRMFDNPATDYGRLLIASAPRQAADDTVPEPTTASERTPDIAGNGLAKTYRVAGQALHALRGVSIAASRGETVAIVGESGCGKSTLARLLVGLESPDEGEVTAQGLSVGSTDEDRRRLASVVQFVFQDPYSSLDPHWSALRIVSEPLLADPAWARRDAEGRAAELLRRVGLPTAMHGRKPVAFSGGQRQRIAIARALIRRPAVLVADEPLSALDMTIQRQIVELLDQLRRSDDLGLIIVSHDLQLVREIADRVVVMYLGRVIEAGPASRVFGAPRHPYTIALLAAADGEAAIRGEAPSPIKVPPGCAFSSRCPKAEHRCRREDPPLDEDRDGHASACWFPRGRQSCG